MASIEDVAISIRLFILQELLSLFKVLLDIVKVEVADLKVVGAIWMVTQMGFNF